MTLFWCRDCTIGIYKYACTCVVVLTFVLALLEERKGESVISGGKVFFLLVNLKYSLKTKDF